MWHNILISFPFPHLMLHSQNHRCLLYVDGNGALSEEMEKSHLFWVFHHGGSYENSVLIWKTPATITDSSAKVSTGSKTTNVYFMPIIEHEGDVPRCLAAVFHMATQEPKLHPFCGCHFLGLCPCLHWDTGRGTSTGRAHCLLRTQAQRQHAKLLLTNHWLELSCILCLPARVQER